MAGKTESGDVQRRLSREEMVGQRIARVHLEAAPEPFAGIYRFAERGIIWPRSAAES